MFELFLVMMVLSSPILITIFVRNYFNYKSENNQKLLTLQKNSDSNTVIATQKKLDILVGRVIVLEKIITNSNMDLSHEIAQL
ncbi:MAG: hypothetical protein HRT54_11010 [Colwellia sp.]|nr:hypothetical protein [Colwellia sp.]